MASVLKVNTLTGVTTAGSIAVTGEGNSTTTNLQQGLLKVWHNYNGTGTVATNDSFNVGSITDNASGDYSTTFSNNMGNANYLHLHHAIEASVYTGYIANSYSKTTSAIRMDTDADPGGGFTNDDFVHNNLGVSGDLA